MNGMKLSFCTVTMCPVKILLRPIGSFFVVNCSLSCAQYTWSVNMTPV